MRGVPIYWMRTESEIQAWQIAQRSDAYAMCQFGQVIQSYGRLGTLVGNISVIPFSL
jgi:hypothetical protein